MPSTDVEVKARVERHLRPEERAVIREFCRLLRKPRAEWREVPSLRVVFDALAELRLAEQYRLDDGLSEERALLRAASVLGMEDGGNDARKFRRWRASNGGEAS